MTHNQENIDVHHEGDSHDLNVTVNDSSGSPVNLSGASVTWLLKETPRDDDTAALITKEGTEGSSPTGVTFTEPSNGELTIHIETGETEGIVDWQSITSLSQEFHHRLRVTDTDGDRSTGFTGTFVINR